MPDVPTLYKMISAIQGEIVKTADEAVGSQEEASADQFYPYTNVYSKQDYIKIKTELENVNFL